MARISRSQTFLSATKICVWWKRVKQQPKPQTTFENKKRKDCIRILGSSLSY